MITEALESEAFRRAEADLRRMNAASLEEWVDELSYARKSEIAQCMGGDYRTLGLTLMQALRNHRYEYWVDELTVMGWDGNWRAPDRRTGAE